MITSAVGSTRLRLAILAAAVIGILALVVAVTDSGSAGVPGMPANVKAIVGADPMIVTLHGDALALISEPDVQTLAGVEKRVAGESFVAAEYGLSRWLSAQIDQLKVSVRAHTSAKVRRADLLVRAGATGSLDLGDSTLTSTLVFGTGSTPVAHLRWLVPGANTVRLFVKLAPGANTTVARRTLARLLGGDTLPGVTVSIANG